jgi:PAS domain S-box-containing protein
MGYNSCVENLASGVQRRLPPHASSVGEARRLVRTELIETGREDLVDAAELLVSELVTNALVHAGTTIEVTARVTETGLRVEVGDGSPNLPAPRHHARMAGTGRGLRLLQQMVDSWGAHPYADGKVVWFELVTGDQETENLLATEPTARQALGPDTVPVELLNVPLLLHLAWHQHAEALLREYLLISIGDEDGLEALQAHAASSEAIALLHEHIEHPQLSEDADELMAYATEPGVSSPRQVLPVPAETRESFRVLGETLEAALKLAETGAFLTSPTQPEIRSFRRWICGEVERQSEGGEPIPWSADGDGPPPPERSELGWTTSHVTASTRALIAADDTGRIIAISPSALELLGYDDASQLVSKRLVAIIPPRFRQAHLAGFTLFFSTGRAPLLGRAVTVPALRRDGSEVPVELTIRSESLGWGRHVFVAVLRD